MSAAAATLILKSVSFRNSTEDLHPAEIGHGLLYELVTRIPADEDGLDITLVDVSSTLSLGADSDDDEPQDQVPLSNCHL